MAETEKMIKEKIIWQPEVDGKPMKIPVTVVYYPQAIAKNTKQLHFYPGLGEDVLLTKAGVKKLAEHGLYAVGVILPFHYLPVTPVNIQRTLIEVPALLAEVFNKRADNPPNTPVDLFGKSQGGGTVLLAASYAPKKYGAIASLIPAGLNKEALGSTPEERLKAVKWRIWVLNNMNKEQSLLDTNNIVAWYEVLKSVFKDMFSGRLDHKLNYALSMDVTNLPETFMSLQELSQTHDISIFAATNDPVVKLDEVKASLKRVGLEHLLKEIPGIHANSISRAGQEQIGIVAEWIKEIRAKRVV